MKTGGGMKGGGVMIAGGMKANCGMKKGGVTTAGGVWITGRFGILNVGGINLNTVVRRVVFAVTTTAGAEKKRMSKH
jgi:hypothetical protein